MPLKTIKIILYLLLLTLGSGKAAAQDFIVKAKKEIFAGFTGSTSGYNPFWLRSNVYGTVPIESNYLSFGGKIHKDYDSTYSLKRKLNHFDYGYGVDIITNIGKVQEVNIPELYAKVRYKDFELYVGKRKEIFGIADTTLSSGSFSWSGNATPLPKIQIATPNYVSIAGNGLLSIKGGFAHGWFDNDRPYTKNVLLHQKWLYAKLGKNSWKVNMYAGFNHQSMWSGLSPFNTRNGKLPTGFKNYLSVVLGTRNAIKAEDADFFDTNRIGNHIGSLDLGINVNSSLFDINVYRQSLYEDGSLYYLLNILDGLNGISFKLKNSKIIKSICLEYLNTSNQGGNVFIIGEKYLRGQDNYYLNGQYQDGYTNKNRIIGTPLIQINSLNWSEGKFEYTIFKMNNRVRAFHLALNGTINRLNFETRLTKSINYGRYSEFEDQGFLINQLSALGKANYQLIKNKYVDKITLNLAHDNNGLYQRNLGMQFGLSKSL